MEFDSGHVEGAVHVPLDTLPGAIAALAPEIPVVTVCGKGGGRSEHAGRLLREAGRADTRSLCGGSRGLAWKGSDDRGSCC